MPLSKIEENKLRKGRAIELVAGGVWYYKDAHGHFKRVVSDLDHLDDGYRIFIKNCSNLGFLYLNRDKPNYSVTDSCHDEDLERIDYYKRKNEQK